MATGEYRRTAYLATGLLNLNGVGATTITGGPALDLSLVKEGTLSATVELDAETNTITLEAFWQASNVAGGAGAYFDVPAVNNPAIVVWATGTAGADAAVTKILPAPAGIYGNLYARVAVRNLVAAGLAEDTYQIGYNFIQAKT